MKKINGKSLRVSLILCGQIALIFLLIYYTSLSHKVEQRPNDNQVYLSDVTPLVSDSDRERAFRSALQERLQNIFCQYDGIASSKVELGEDGFALVTLTLEDSSENVDKARLISTIQNCVSHAYHYDPANITIKIA